MSTARRLRHDETERACLTCQRRKTRCVFDTTHAACVYCRKVGKTCTVTERPARTPLTRKNLDTAESRCKELELQLQQLRCELSTNSIPQTTSGSQDTESSCHGATLSEDTIPKSNSGDSPLNQHYEWREQSDLNDGSVRDGMASFTRNYNGSGYLGNGSGSSLLEILSSHLVQRDSTSTSHPTTKPEDEAAQPPGFIFSSKLTQNTMTEHFIQVYFIAYNSAYPILHERIFRQQCEKRSQTPASSIWHVIYYTVLALGEWLCGCSTDHQSLYYEAARSRLRFDLLESGNLGIVQAFLLLGNYLQKRDRPNTAYNLIGIAYRVALGLGLNRELSGQGDVRSIDTQKRRRLFWVLYSIDSGFSITTGRPTLVSQSCIDVREPDNLDDSLDAGSPHAMKEVYYPTTCSAIIAQARLAVIANEIHNKTLLACPHVRGLSALEQAIQTWRESLPGYFFEDGVPQWFLGPRQVLLWRASNLQIMLYLATQRHQLEIKQWEETGNKCQVAALDTIFDISKFCNEHTGIVHAGLNWYAVYFLLHALLALGIQQALSVNTEPSQPRSLEQISFVYAWENAALAARDCLSVLGCHSKAAIRTLQILDRLQGAYEQSQTAADNRQPNFLQEFRCSPTYAPMSPNSRFGYSLAASASAVCQNDLNEPSNDQPMGLQNIFWPDGLLDGPATDSILDDWIGIVTPSSHMVLESHDPAVSSSFGEIPRFPINNEFNSSSHTADVVPRESFEANKFNLAQDHI